MPAASNTRKKEASAKNTAALGARGEAGAKVSSGNVSAASDVDLADDDDDLLLLAIHLYDDESDDWLICPYPGCNYVGRQAGRGKRKSAAVAHVKSHGAKPPKQKIDSDGPPAWLPEPYEWLYCPRPGCDWCVKNCKPEICLQRALNHISAHNSKCVHTDCDIPIDTRDQSHHDVDWHDGQNSTESPLSIDCTYTAQHVKHLQQHLQIAHVECDYEDCNVVLPQKCRCDGTNKTCKIEGSGFQTRGDLSRHEALEHVLCGYEGYQRRRTTRGPTSIGVHLIKDHGLDGTAVLNRFTCRHKGCEAKGPSPKHVRRHERHPHYECGHEECGLRTTTHFMIARGHMDTHDGVKKRHTHPGLSDDELELLDALFVMHGTFEGAIPLVHSLFPQYHPYALHYLIRDASERWKKIDVESSKAQLDKLFSDIEENGLMYTIEETKAMGYGLSEGLAP